LVDFLGSSSSTSPTKPSQNDREPEGQEDLAIALYSYNSDAAGDLSFQRDEKIHILQKSEKENDWWYGRLGSREGYFPGNYVRLL